MAMNPKNKELLDAYKKFYGVEVDPHTFLPIPKGKNFDIKKWESQHGIATGIHEYEYGVPGNVGKSPNAVLTRRSLEEAPSYIAQKKEMGLPVSPDEQKILDNYLSWRDYELDLGVVKRGTMPSGMGKENLKYQKRAKWWGKHVKQREKFFSGLSLKNYSEELMAEVSAETGLDISKLKGVKGRKDFSRFLSVFERTAQDKEGYFLETTKGRGVGTFVSKPSMEASTIYIPKGKERGYAKRFLGQSKILRELEYTPEQLAAMSIENIPFSSSGKVVPIGSSKITGAFRMPWSYDPLLSDFTKASPKRALNMLRQMYFSTERGLISTGGVMAGDIGSILGASVERQGAEWADKLLSEGVAATEGADLQDALGQLIQEVGGQEALATESEILPSNVVINKNKIKKIQKRVGEYIKKNRTAPTWIERKVSGFSAIKSEVEKAKVGDIFRLSSGKSAIVQDLEELSAATVMNMRGKPLLFEKYMEAALKEKELLQAPYMFKVWLRRSNFLGAPGVAPDPYAIDVLMPEGFKVGAIGRKYSEAFSKQYAANVAEGMIPGEWWAKIYEREAGKSGEKLWSLGLFRKYSESAPGWYEKIDPMFQLVGEKIIPLPEEFAAQTGFKSMQEFLKAVKYGKYQVSDLTEEMLSRFKKEYPQKFFVNARRYAKVNAAGGVSKSGVPFEKIELPGATIEDKLLNKKWIAAAAITAGALLLWGASRSKNQPITEQDVPDSQYGNIPLDQGGQSQVYTPAARVTPRNAGYATNLDLQVEDSTGTSDYRAMASNIGMIAKRATGTGNVRTSLHVVDDSERMDRESTRRKMNQYLGA